MSAKNLLVSTISFNGWQLHLTFIKFIFKPVYRMLFLMFTYIIYTYITSANRSYVNKLCFLATALVVKTTSYVPNQN